MKNYLNLKLGKWQIERSETMRKDICIAGTSEEAEANCQYFYDEQCHTRETEYLHIKNKLLDEYYGSDCANNNVEGLVDALVDLLNILDEKEKYKLEKYKL